MEKYKTRKELRTKNNRVYRKSLKNDWIDFN